MGIRPQPIRPSGGQTPFSTRPINCKIETTLDTGFARWMSNFTGVIAISTYQAGKVGFIGWDGGQVRLLMRDFDKPMGLAFDGASLAVATRDSVILAANEPRLASHIFQGGTSIYDSLFLPRAIYLTGDIQTHDLAFDNQSNLWMVNTRFCCLATINLRFNFQPRWKPTFVTALVPEDRCHLNGLAMVDGEPGYVTAMGSTDVQGGWRAGKATGGIVIDIRSDKTIASGLSMPHSPRWHDGQLWFLNSGAGELCRIDPETGKQDMVCQFPGYLRGLCFAGRHALVGLCRIREKHVFCGLPVQQRFGHENLRCGIAVVNLDTKAQEGFFEFSSGCEEIYDVILLANLRNPMILNTKSEQSRQALSTPESAFWVERSTQGEHASGQAN